MKIIDNNFELEKSIKQTHFLDYQEYCEIMLSMKPDEDGFCYRCNKPLDPLTYFIPDFYYQPHWGCMSKRKSDRDALTTSLIRNIHDLYGKIIGDRYYQLFLVDDIYPKTTFPHEYNVFKKTVNSLDPPSRNDIWFLDWLPGYPKIINIDNLQGIKIVNLTKQYDPIKIEKEKILIGEYEILGPEITVFDSRHHSRYSILNKNGDRKSKRIKLGDKCIKFYNTNEEDVKSIFKVLKNGEEIAIRSLSYQDYVIIKLAIMRNKTFLKLVFDIIEETCRQSGILRDSIFLKNTVYLNPRKDLTVSFIWSELSEYRDIDGINISII